MVILEFTAIIILILLLIRKWVEANDHTDEYCFYCGSRDDLKLNIDYNGRPYYVCPTCEEKIRKIPPYL